MRFHVSPCAAGFSWSDGSRGPSGPTWPCEPWPRCGSPFRRRSCTSSAGGRWRAQAEALTAELGLNGAVKFLGNREDVPELLARAECALLASDYEGCPLAVVEAMAAGVPVVATDAGGSGELVESAPTREASRPRH